MRILVVGASGYVGGRLAARLVEHGHHVRLASRDPRGLSDRFPTAEVVRLDLLDPATLPAALEG
ncbi:MAG TPA: NAD(P)H-binding protein, partial [Candidatus Deferrimicrobium sp.]|nr:NAD(P)H-binding protein [Candidatus Deferrimicrobium sp.]